jgi:Uma2 family endonuclease
MLFSETLEVETMSAVLKRKFEDEELYPVQQEGKPMAETDKHASQIFEILGCLRNFFQEQQVYIAADMTFYYDENDARKWIVPDVFVVKGVSTEPRRVFKLWEEGVPDVVFEISSRQTWGDDLNRKWKLYEQLGVKEYYIFDPEYDYLPEPIVAYRLNKRGELKKIRVRHRRIFSEALALDLVDIGQGLRFFNPATKQFLRNLRESENALAETENALAETENALAKTENALAEKETALETERNARLTAEAELARLRAEIEQLKNK